MRIILFTFFFIATSIQLKSQSGVTYGNPSSNEEGYLIKADNSYVYTISASYLNGTEFPIITKFNKTTYAILWQKRLTYSIRINDAVFIGNDNNPSHMYLVGHSLPEDINNNSILLKLDLSSGAIICSQTYSHYGSERFSKIIRHDNPLNTAFPYYILGIHTVNGHPNPAIGKMVLWNISANCETSNFVNFTREYNLANDDEFHRGLVALNDKTILLTGNRVSDGFGMLVNVDGNGNVIRSTVLSVDMEIEDGVALNNGNFIFVGEEFIPSNRRAIVFMTDKDFNFLTGFRIPNIDKFDDIQTNLNGNIYVVGNHYTNTFSTIKYPVVFRIGYTSTVPFAMIISKQNTLDYNVSNSYKSSAINLNSGIIHYIDGRSQTSNYNVNIAQSDSNVDFACQSVYQHSVIGMEFTTQTVSVTSNGYTRPTFTGFTNSDVVIPTTTWCGVPCNLEVSTIKTQINNCGLYSITANVSGGTNPYTYSWDIGCNSSIEGNTNPINHQFSSGGTIPYCVTVTDATGCIKTLSNQTIVVAGDFVPPVITCPATTTINCDADEFNFSFTGTATAVDLIDPSPTVSHVQDVTNITNNCSSTITRTWKATDDCGNMSTCQQLIIKRDLTGPVVDCPDNINVGCESDLYDPMITGHATAIDNCNSVVELQPTLSGSGTSCALEWVKVYRFQDACGNIGSCTQLIITYDDTTPIITCPSNLTLSCGANTDPSQTGFATATDACQTELTITYLDAILGNDCDKTITRTWTAEDGCANESTCVQTIRLLDQTPPTFLCPASNWTPIECTANPILGQPTNVMDNCGGNIIQSKIDVLSKSGCITTVNRTWTVTDECGNSATCEQVITMEDTKPPVISGCGRRVIIQGIRNVDGICSGDVTLTSPLIFDQCDENVVLTNSYTLTDDASASYPVGQTIIIWTAKDDCGLMAMCQDTIIVLDCPDCCWDSDAFDELTQTLPQIRRENCTTQISIPGLTACQRVKIDWGDGALSGYLTTPAVFNHDYLVSGDYQACALYEEIAADGSVCYSETVCYDICVECGPECEEVNLVNSCHTTPGFTSTEDRYAVNKFDMIHANGKIYTVSGILNGGTDMDAAIIEMNEDCEIKHTFYYGDGYDQVASVIKFDPVNNQFIVTGIFNSPSWAIPGYPIPLIGSGTQFSGFVMAINATLFTVNWAFSIGNMGRSAIYDMDIDGLGNIYIVGSASSGIINFDPATPPTLLASINLAHTSGFVAKYNPAGGYMWHELFEPIAFSYAAASISAIEIVGNNIFVGGALTVSPPPPATGTATLILSPPLGVLTVNAPEFTHSASFLVKLKDGLPYPTRICSEILIPTSNLLNGVTDIESNGTDLYVSGHQFFNKYSLASPCFVLMNYYLPDYHIYNIELSPTKIFLAGSNPKPQAMIDFVGSTFGINSSDWEMITTILDITDCSYKKSMVLGGSYLDYNFGLLALPGDNFYIHGVTRSNDFKYTPPPSPILYPSPTLNESTVFIGKYSCECTEEVDCCAETSASLAGSDICCKSIDLINQADFQVTHIGVEVITPGWSIGTSTIGAGYNVTSAGSEYIIQNTAGLIPVGNINGIFDFCLAGTGAIPTAQQIVVRWYETSISGNMTVVCSDTLDLFCDPVPLPIACLDYTLISVVCDPDDDLSYFMTFSITNLTSDVNATSVYLSGLPAGFYFESCGGGGLVTSINIPIGLPIGPGQTSGNLCVKINTSGSILSPQDVCFDLQLKGLDGNISTCCNAPEPECINIQPCCDPCEDISFTVEPLEENQDDCCYALIMDNSCQYDYFTKMEIQVNTADVHFGYLNAATGWSNCATPTLQSICIQPNSGSFPNGNHIPTLSFCLTNINDESQVPQDIVVSLYSSNGPGIDFIACEKAFQLACDTIPNDSCLIVTNSTAFCDQENEKYLVSVTIENNSNPDFCANEVVITPLDLGEVMPSVILLPDFLCHGESTTITFMITDLPFPDVDGMFEVLFSLKNNLSEECCQGGVAHIDTILLPDCPCAATCCEDLPEHDFESYNLGNLPNTQVGWQDISGIPSVVPGGAGGSAQSVLLPAHSRGLMPSAIEYRHAGVGGPDLILPENSLICLNFWAKLNPIPTLPVNGVLTIQFDHTTVHSLTILHTNSAWTYYELSLITPPGGVYKLQFINHSPAPVVYGPSIQMDDICFEVKNQIYNDNTPPDITCPDDITLLDPNLDCIVEYTISNLSITDPSGIAFVNYYLDGNLVMIGSTHPLDNTMNHEVVCIAEDVCGNQETCTFYIMVECAEDCCFDEMKFISSVESAVTYTVDNSNCIATINIGDLPDCDYIQNINWGDGTIMSGPFTGGEILTHTYIGNGTFTISMLANETNPITNIICFEHVISREITLNCSGCICPTVSPIFTISQGQVRTDVACGNTIQLECPVTDLFINGIFRCESTSSSGQSCPPNSISWVLDRPSLPDMSGTSGSTVSFMLDVVAVQEPGLYTLTFSTLCADSPAPCICSISWMQEDCNQDICPSCPSGSMQSNNLVENGDFELGNDGSFISEYTFLNTGLLNSGNYGVRNSVTLSNANWANLDHTTFNPNGLFLVADGTNAGQFIWQQSIPVIEGNTYVFCAWFNNLVVNLLDSNAPIIEVHANGNVIVGPTPIPQIPDNWILISGTHTATTTGIIDIQIFNTATSGYSDIAIDDITFTECLMDTCCKDEKMFINSTETSCGLGKDPDKCILYLNIDLLNPCVKIDLIEWGDGSSTLGPLSTGQLFNHTYATSGLYQIKVTFSEYNSMGVKCWSNVWESKRISLDCKSTPNCVCDRKGFKIGKTIVDCNNTPVLIPCPGKSPVFISGYLGCLPANVCNTNNVTYIIKDASGLPVVNGVLNANFNLQLIGSWFSPLGGTYSIEFITYCNGTPCKCTLNFIVPSCPQSCLCDQNFNTVVDLGFDIQNFKGSCKKKLTPKNLCPKDKVTWTLNGVVSLPSTLGEDPKYITLTSQISNKVCMIVDREENSFKKCRDTFCMVFPGCTISNPIPLGDTCIWPHNSIFTNAVDGLFDNEGDVPMWELKTGEGFVSTDMGLTYDNVVLISSQNNPTDLYQSCCIDPLDSETKKLIKASVFLQYLGNYRLPLGSKLQIIMPKDVTIDPEAKIIAEIDLSTIRSEWAEYDFYIKEENYCNVNNNLYIRFLNPSDNDEAIRIDNLCFELDTCIVATNDITEKDIIILPNPTSGQLTINFNTEIDQTLTLRVIDILGRELSREYIVKGSNYYNFSIEDMAGVYIIQLSDKNGNGTQRIVIKME